MHSFTSCGNNDGKSLLLQSEMTMIRPGHAFLIKIADSGITEVNTNISFITLIYDF